MLASPKLMNEDSPWVLDGQIQKVLILREDHSDVPFVHGYKQILLYGPYWDALQIVEFTKGLAAFITFDVALLLGLKDVLRADCLYFCSQGKLRRADECCRRKRSFKNILGTERLFDMYLNHEFDRRV